MRDLTQAIILVGMICAFYLICVGIAVAISDYLLNPAWWRTMRVRNIENIEWLDFWLDGNNRVVVLMQSGEYQEGHPVVRAGSRQEVAYSFGQLKPTLRSDFGWLRDHAYVLRLRMEQRFRLWVERKFYNHFGPTLDEVIDDALGRSYR